MDSESLKKLADLREKGILTEEEYLIKKQLILKQESGDVRSADGPLQNAPAVNDHLAKAILTIFLCVPTGIVSLIYSLQVNVKLSAGDVNGALESSRKANLWANLTAIPFFMVVLVGIVMALTQPFIAKPKEDKIIKATVQVRIFDDALKLYRLDNGEYRSTEQGLKALVEKPSVGNIPREWRDGGYLEKGIIPKDPWGNDYVYRNPGMHNHGRVDVYSCGPEGLAGDKSKIIGNWDLS